MQVSPYAVVVFGLVFAAIVRYFSTNNIEYVSRSFQAATATSMRAPHEDATEQSAFRSVAPELDRPDSNGNVQDQIQLGIYLVKPTHDLKMALQTFLTSLRAVHTYDDIHIHILCDTAGCRHAADVHVSQVFNTTNYAIQRFLHTAKPFIDRIQYIVSIPLTSHYTESLFLLSPILHQLLSMDKLLLLDIDVKVNQPLWPIWHRLAHFSTDTCFGLAYEQQPVYRHLLHEYRSRHPNTTFGSAPGNGFPGFNSGVLLLHLKHMRQNPDYNQLLTSGRLTELAKVYGFHGHLGDQDIYTLLYIAHPEWFNVLPCGYNRQLCTWWGDHGYEGVFDAYHRCDDDVIVWHGNCHSQIP
eukprot:TRINITY_DN5876_c0_g1_i1.p1 TRINITY_DN5876_c0_g1~~TRINITY_DN5876_c0_g1_i1.p1  ORF type:complete len:354 (+),score=37.90 TRINITY_DN5876_c0_g1_i1:66-1127(+)